MEGFKLENNLTAIKSYMVSMQCAIDKAENGSPCEDAYFMEKMEKAANRMGFDLVKKERPEFGMKIIPVI